MPDKTAIVNEEMQPLILRLVEIARREGINLVCEVQTSEHCVSSTVVVDSARMRPCPVIQACSLAVRASIAGIPVAVAEIEVGGPDSARQPFPCEGHD